MNLPEVNEMYKTDERFKTFVDKYRANHGLVLEVAIKHKIVNETAEYYKRNKEVK